MRTFGSGQTSGLPLLLTTTAQVLHTAVAGGGTPERITVLALASDAKVRVNIGVYNGATLVAQQSRLISNVVDSGFEQPSFPELVLNGGMVVKAWVDGGTAYVTAVVDNQGDVAGVASQIIVSGLVAAVQNASRFAVNAQGGTGNATEANAQVLIPRAGILRNLRAVASATIGGGATVTVSIRKNGAATALSIALAAADTTVMATDTDSITVAAGDLITFSIATTNDGAPAANIQASVELI